MMLLLWILTCASAVRVAPPANIPFTESGILDHDVYGGPNPPGFGHPRYNITCLGQSDIPWAFEPVHYDGRSLQKVCSLEQYGGQVDPNYNAGGYCEGADVAFHFGSWTFRGTGVNPLKRIRQFLECRTRCFCNYNLEDPSQQPKLVPRTRMSFSGPLPRDPKAITISVDRKTAAGWAHPALLTRMLVNWPDNTPRQGYDVGILPSNMIECGGPLPLPTFDLAGPYSISEIPNNQKLCAMQLSGGGPAVNAGGYCHRSPDGSRSVSFADDMTPRWDWTWNSAGTFFNTASVRLHCWKNCLCAQPSKKPNYKDPLVPGWEFILSMVERHTLAITTGNRNPLGSSTDAKGNIKSTSTASGSNQPAAQCAADSSGKCTIPWPVEIMGPIPEVVMKLAPPRAPVGWDPKKQCGNHCDSNVDCGSDCLCRVPSTEEAHSLGVDPVSAAALCISLASVFG